MEFPMRRALVQLQDRAFSLFGGSEEARAPLVSALLRRDASEAASYYLQLLVSVGIATMGLVLGSAAVVIGAMLVAPLMGPILSLGMGLAAGSPYLVLRSAGRVALSVGIVVFASALLTLALPFHQVNAELAARTTPTVLDLVTAGFCALAGVYSMVKPGSDTATTAAGTSIGISLVPPLCASGFGFGTGDARIAFGAALLFLTNFVAIVVVSTVGFVAIGFNRVDVVALESRELSETVTDAPIARALARRLSRLFSSRFGSLSRFLMPFVLLAAVYVPLRRALDEVVWQVRVRSTVEKELAKVAQPVVRNQILVERGEVQGSLVLLGTVMDAARVKAALEERIEAASGIRPKLSVSAVPDATAFAGLQASIQSQTHAQPSAALVVPPRSPREVLGDALDLANNAIAKRWPSQAAGSPLRVSIAEAGLVLEVGVIHLGQGLSPDARESVERVLAADLSRPVRIFDEAIPSGLSSDTADHDVFVERLSRFSALAVRAGLTVCLEAPRREHEGKRARASLSEEAAFDVRVREAAAPQARIASSSDTEAWRVSFQPGECTAVSADGGVAR